MGCWCVLGGQINLRRCAEVSDCQRVRNSAQDDSSANVCVCVCVCGMVCVRSGRVKMGGFVCERAGTDKIVIRLFKLCKNEKGTG